MTYKKLILLLLIFLVVPLSYAQQQEEDVECSLDCLVQVGVDRNDWVMCYPYGIYDDSLVEMLKRKSCRLGIATKVDVAGLTVENAFRLERLDTNDLPKKARTV